MRLIHKEYYTLANGVKIPKIAFGTWQIQGADAYNSTISAIKAGYIHIDTALAYGNEAEIGRALKDLNVNRNELFITSKLPAEIKGYNEAKEAFNKTITNLGTTYLDLYLIHAPLPWSEMWGAPYRYEKENLASWKAMEELYNEGKIRAIGVSNFNVYDLDNIINNSKIVPMVNQVYCCPGSRRFDLEEYSKKHNILIEAYSPFATGRIFKSTVLKDLAEKYNVSVAQLALKWCLDRNTLPLPKSVNEDRIIQNLNVDFEIEEADLEIMDKVDISK